MDFQGHVGLLFSRLRNNQHRLFCRIRFEHTAEGIALVSDLSMEASAEVLAEETPRQQNLTAIVKKIKIYKNSENCENLLLA